MVSRVIYVCPIYEEYKQDFKSKRIWRTDGKYEPFVYIIQEVETEKMYIGSKTQYKRRPCLESWLGTKYFTSSNEFDWESDPNSFEILEIISCASNHDAIILEGMLIKDYDAVKSCDYYNLHHPHVGWNTSGRIISEEHRKRLSKSSRKGKSLSKEHRRNVSLAMKGIVFTEEHKKNMSISQKGKKLTKIHRKRIGEANKKRTHTEETKEKMSISAKNRAPYPKIECPFCGKIAAPGAYARWHGDNCRKV